MGTGPSGGPAADAVERGSGVGRPGCSTRPEVPATAGGAGRGGLCSRPVHPGHLAERAARQTAAAAEGGPASASAG
eukprot:2364604-Alexandrium_andersonii.AAC.1